MSDNKIIAQKPKAKSYKRKYWLCDKKLIVSTVVKVYFWISTILPALSQVNSGGNFIENTPYYIYADQVEINSKAAEIVSDERLTKKVGITLKPGVISVVDGKREEPDTTKKIEKTKLEFTSYRQYGNQSNSLSIWVSTDFSGNYTEEGINNATWTEITSRAVLSTGLDNTPSGPINLSDLASRGPIYLAFRYMGVGGTTQRAWTIKNLVIKNQLDDDTEYPIATIGDAGWTWVRLNPSSSQQRWQITDTQLQFVGGNETYGSNLGWVITKALDLKKLPSINDEDKPDLVFKIKAPKAGRYKMNTMAVTDEEGEALMKKASLKTESLFMRVQIGDQRSTKRVICVPWNVPKQKTGKFTFSGEEEEIKIWLPRGVRLDYVELQNYIPPAVPAAATNYKPGILPPATHPRLWVTPESLPIVKSRLEIGENKAAWERVKRFALAPFSFNPDPNKELLYNYDLEYAVEQKAFYYLMTGDRQIGREAIELMKNYISLVEFGNLLDVTREIGRAIYTSAEVYDWTYDLLTAEEKQILVNNMLRLADDMEIGWPPFLQKITNGHGNEAQINRDLLSMAIAIYDEDPLPYQYCAYTIFEELIPMRKFEYASPRHNQGISYGAYRMGWELHNAWLFYRMTGERVFDDNIMDVNKYWTYMRAPGNMMLTDGDGPVIDTVSNPAYWTSAMMLMASAYAKDPILKGEFLRYGGLPYNPVPVLLVNDPELKPQSNLELLPLTMDFGPVLGSMIARTGWDMEKGSDDVIAEIKGGGYHFGGHQHADAGSMQLYYRGFQLGDIGLYGFYGTPYDLGFNKRSASHSMMLVHDPSEQFLLSTSNDGGARFNLVEPSSPTMVQANSVFDNGKVVSSEFGPSKQKPLFSYFSANLTQAYSSKVSQYTRGFCFINMDRKDIPAAIILTDDISVADSALKKYWQINTYNLPEKTRHGVILHSQSGDAIGKAHVQMLVPSPLEVNTEILSGKDAYSSFNSEFDVPAGKENTVEAHSYRIMVSPSNPSERNRFLTVFQLADGDTSPLPVRYEEVDGCYVIYIADRVVGMNSGPEFINKSISIITVNKKYQVALTGLKAGKWNVKSQDGKEEFNVKVVEGKNTLFFEASADGYVISPRMNCCCCGTK